jgi:hypothetical protein
MNTISFFFLHFLGDFFTFSLLDGPGNATQENNAKRKKIGPIQIM